MKKLRDLVDSGEPINALFVVRFFVLVRQVLEASHERKKYLNLALICDLLIHSRLDFPNPVKLLREVSEQFNKMRDDASLTETFSDSFRLQKAADQLANLLTVHGIVIPEPLFLQKLWACAVDELSGARIDAAPLIYRDDGTLDRKMLLRHIGEHERFTTVALEMARRDTPEGLQAFFVQLEMIFGFNDRRDGPGRFILLAPPIMFRCEKCAANYFHNPDGRSLICGGCGRVYPLPEAFVKAPDNPPLTADPSV